MTSSSRVSIVVQETAAVSLFVAPVLAFLVLGPGIAAPLVVAAIFIALTHYYGRGLAQAPTRTAPLVDELRASEPESAGTQAVDHLDAARALVRSVEDRRGTHD
jgi:hypothetical protein